MLLPRDFKNWQCPLNCRLTPQFSGGAPTYMPWYLSITVRCNRLLAGAAMPVIMAFPPLLAVVGNL